jgi:hypothetical protein
MTHYNIFLRTTSGESNLFNIPEDDLARIVEAYNLGNDSVFIDGERISLKGLRVLKIFSFEGIKESIYEFMNSESIKELLLFNNLTGQYVLDYPELKKLGEEVTKKYLENDFGWKKKEEKVDNILMLKKQYINIERIEQLKELKSEYFDFKKLVRICEEINITYNLDCFYAVGNLLRSTLDHIAPILGHKTFKEVANNYAGSKSFKDAMQTLENSLRKISDGFLHLPIRKSEVLPTINQVEYIALKDLLIAEIVRVTIEKK